MWSRLQRTVRASSHHQHNGEAAAARELNAAAANNSDRMRLLQTFAWLLLATSVDCAAPQKPLSVYVHAAEPFPSLLDATLSDLTTALEEGKLSSVNLTKVGHLEVLGNAPSLSLTQIELHQTD